MCVGRGYFTLSGLNSDNKVRVCIVVAGVLVCLFVFWFVAVTVVSFTSLCVAQVLERGVGGRGKGGVSGMDP